MENHISDRLQFIIKELGYNVTSFSKAIGINNNVTIGRIIIDKRRPGGEIMEKIIQTFGNINANWLLTGQGDVFITETKKTDALTHKEKIELYLKTKNKTKAEFYKMTGFGNGFLDSGNSVGSERIPIIKKYYPDLNIDWLLMDQGPMIINKENAPSTLSEPNALYNKDNKAIKFDINQYLTEKDLTIQEAYQEIGRLKQQIADLKQH